MACHYNRYEMDWLSALLSVIEVHNGLQPDINSGWIDWVLSSGRRVWGVDFENSISKFLSPVQFHHHSFPSAASNPEKPNQTKARKTYSQGLFQRKKNPVENRMNYQKHWISSCSNKYSMNYSRKRSESKGKWKLFVDLMEKSAWNTLVIPQQIISKFEY